MASIATSIREAALGDDALLRNGPSDGVLRQIIYAFIDGRELHKYCFSSTVAHRRWLWLIVAEALEPDIPREDLLQAATLLECSLWTDDKQLAASLRRLAGGCGMNSFTAFAVSFTAAIAGGVYLVTHDHPWFALLVFLIAASMRATDS